MSSDNRRFGDLTRDEKLDLIEHIVDDGRVEFSVTVRGMDYELLGYKWVLCMSNYNDKLSLNPLIVYRKVESDDA